MRKLTVLAVPLLLLWSAAGAQADAVQVGAFNGSDSIDWSQLALGFQGANSQPVTTANGGSATVTVERTGSVHVPGIQQLRRRLRHR